MHHSIRSAFLFAVPLIATQAFATEGAIFSGLGYAGDGVTPSMLEYTERQNPQLLQAGHVGQAGERGDFAYGVPIPLQPALFSPSVSLSYNSSGGVHNRVGRGWSLDTGMQITTLSRREQAGSHINHADVFRVSGGGLSGLLQFSTEDAGVEAYNFVSSSTTFATADYDTNAQSWTVFIGGQQWTLEPRFSNSDDPRSWHVTSAVDQNNNAITWSYTGTRIDAIEYGGNLNDADLYPPTANVRFEYETRLPENKVRSYKEGEEESFGVRLSQVVVESRKVVEPVFVTVATYVLDPVDVAGSINVGKVRQVGHDGNNERVLAAFEYADVDIEMSDPEGEFDLFVGTGELPGSDPRVHYGGGFMYSSSQTWCDGLSPGASCTNPEAGDAHSMSSTSTSDTYSMFHDIDADGYSDLLSTETEVATFIRQFRDGMGWTDSMESIDVTGLDAIDYVGLDTRDTFTVVPAENGNPSISLTLARRQWIDINGDGLLDVIESGDPFTETPTDFAEMVVPIAGPVIGGYPWRIRYGEPDGTITENADWWFAPLPFASVEVSFGQMCRLAADPAQDMPPQVVGDEFRTHHDTVVELRDLTGDGWLDLVWYGKNASQITSLPDGDELDIWVYEVKPHPTFTDPDDGITRTALNPKTSLATTSPEIQSALNANQVLREIDPEWVADQLDGTGDYSIDTACVFRSSRTIRGFVDINGDGLLDFVDTWGGAADEWEVNFNLGDLRWTEARIWAVPSFTDFPGGQANAPAIRWTIEQADDAPALFHDRYGVPQSSLPSPQIPVDVCARIISEPGIGPTGKAPFTFDPISGCPDTGDDPNGTVAVYQNSASVLASSLIDVDGDGLVDLVRSFAHEQEGFSWWRNLGNGFAATDACLDNVCDGPQRGLHVSFSFGQTVSDRFGSDSGSARGDALVVQDLNSDGVMDELDVFEGTIAYGEYHPSGLMIAVTNATGVISDITYGPASDEGDAGDPAVIHARQDNVSADLVVEIDTVNLVTGSEASNSYTYGRRDCPFGQCLGFQDRTITTRAPDHTGLSSGRFSLGATDFERTHVVEEYELYRDGPRRISAQTWTDSNLAWIDAIGASPTTPLIEERFLQTWEYEDIDGAALAVSPPAGPLPRIRLVARTVTEHGEQSDSRTASFTYGYDPEAGTLAGVTEVAGGESRYADVYWTQTADGRQWLPDRKEVRGVDNAIVERLEWSYDNGQMNQQMVCLDGACDEWLNWAFQRHERGMVNLVNGPLGTDMAYPVFRYGGVVSGITVDGMQLETRAQVDDYGRVNVTRSTSSTVANGVRTRVEFDDLGRPTVESVKGHGGAWVLSKTHLYADWAIPGATLPDGTPMTVPVSRTTSFDEGGVVQSDELQVSDGAGGLRQTYKSNHDGSQWIVSDTVSDLFGAQRATTHATSVSTLPIDVQGVWSNTGAVLSWTDVDALGAARVSYPDRSTTQIPGQLGLSECMVVSYAPEPGVTHTIDTTGLHKRLTHDGFGRLVRVQEGRPNEETPTHCPTPPLVASEDATPEITGTYQWDAADRMTRFRYLADGVPVDVNYEYDLAGRQTAVKRQVLGQTEQTWKTFEFDGGFPIRMYDGDSTGQPDISVTSTPTGCSVTLGGSYDDDLDNLATAWSWDNAGRLTQKLVRRDDGYDCYQVEWDTHFPGARSSSTDPTGYTEWQYNDTVGAAGNMGWPSEATRHWADNDDPATFTYDYDLAGSVTATVFPSGAQLDTTRAFGWVTAETVMSSDDNVLAKVKPTWDHRGLASGFQTFDANDNVLSNTPALSVQRTSPTQIDSTTWTVDSIDYVATYQWLGAGALLTGKAFSDSIATPTNTVSVAYQYDSLNRVIDVDVVDSAGTTIDAEKYSYDPMGHLKAATMNPTNAVAEDWTYAWGDRPSTNGEQRYGPSSRTAVGAPSVEEIFAYDDMGRLIGVTDQASSTLSKYHYEGTGQLSAFDSGDGLIEFAHDLDDNLVWRKHGDDTEYWFGAYQVDRHNTSDRVVETILPALQLIDGTEPRWIGREIDGHGLLTFDSQGSLVGAEVLGAYGRPIGEQITNGSLAMNGFQGMERDSAMPATRMGVRHMAKDGRWLQPEPLLTLGGIKPTSPRSWMSTYSSANPITRTDRSGYEDCGVCRAQTWDEEKYLKGEISEQQLKDNRTWRAAGGGIGGSAVGIVALAWEYAPAGLAWILSNSTRLNQAGITAAEIAEPTGVGLGGVTAGAVGAASKGAGLMDDATAAASRFPDKPGQVQHIFRDAAGHLTDTPSNRSLLQGVADDASTTLGTDKFGNTWSASILDDGTQVWVQTRNGVIQNGGVNQKPRTFDAKTGLSGQ